jgi:hypothetical protein
MSERRSATTRWRLYLDHKGEESCTMLGTARRLAIAACAIGTFAPACAAACSQHTFDPCPEPQSGYKLDVDQKTGRTWVKEAEAPTTDTSRLGRLSATAKNVPAGSLPKAAGHAPAEHWRTEVKRDGKPWAPLK